MKTGKLDRILRADKHLLLRHAVGLVRGWLFKSAGRLLGFNLRVGAGLVCTSWPRLFSARGRMVIGDRVCIGKAFLGVVPGARLFIGHGTSINDYVILSANYGIEIGSNVMIAERVSIHDFDHQYASTEVPMNSQGVTGAPVKIGDDVWVGCGAVILKGVTIGRGAIIGANAVVIRDIEEYAVAVGVPARTIKRRDGKAPAVG